MAGLRARLKAATAPEHTALEAASPLSDPALPWPAYLAYLGRTWGYYIGIEPPVLDALAGATRPELAWPARRKIPWLETDLAVLHGAMPDLPRCTELPRIDSGAAALGCAYVLEGATLGGQVLYKRMQRRFGVDAHSGARFLQGYGTDTAARWHAFTHMLDELALPCGCEDACIAAARATFATLGRWLEGGGCDARIADLAATGAAPVRAAPP